MSSDDRQPRIRQRHAMQTDVGVIREHNEDAAYADPDGDFFIVADGMGGHAAGEIASNMAVEAVREALESAREDIDQFARAPSDEGRRSLVGVLENAVRQAHQAVFERGTRESDKQGMGTTLDVVMIAGAEAFVAHVGDSRTYLVRDGRAAQITTDHTVAEVLVIEGKLSPEEAQISPLRTILVNAIGVASDVGVEMAHVRLKQGDKLLLCSDGLHDYFPAEQELSEHVAEPEPADALSKMVEQAKSRGGHDNITGIVLEVLEVPPGSDEPSDFDPGTEDTGSMHALAPEGDIARPEGAPEEIARDDTMPVDLRPTATTLPPPSDGAGGGAGTPVPEEDGDMRETQRIKPITSKKRSRKKRSSKAPASGDQSDDAEGDDAATRDTEETPASSAGRGKAEAAEVADADADKAD